MDWFVNRRRACRAGGLALLAAAMALVPSVASAAPMALSCGDTVTQDTTLTNNLIGCPGDGLIIGADGITLDLGSHVITSSTHTGEGINFNAHNGVQVRGGQIEAFYDDVYINGDGDGVSATQAGVADYESATGFYIDGHGGAGNNNTLSGVQASYASHGILEEQGNGNTLTSATADSNYASNISFGDGANNTITRNSATNSLYGDGIDAGSEAGDTVTLNTATGNSATGIQPRFLSGATVTDNTASDNGELGFYLTGVTRSLIADNRGESNAQNGLGDIFGNGNTLSSNTFNDNGFTSGYHSSGIYVDNLSSHERFSQNNIDGNAGDGITDTGAASILVSNTADFNYGHGITTTSGHGGGNEAHGNLTPPQCVGIVCR